MRIKAAQINPVVGAIDDNVARVLEIAREAADEGCDLAVFPELCVTGYPPKDLLERPAFIAQAAAGLQKIVDASRELGELGIVVGAPLRSDEAEGKALHNVAILVQAGAIVVQQKKILLPTYDVFDEARHFAAGKDNDVFEFKGVRIGLSICEDLWFEPDPWNRRPYACDPIQMLAEKNPQLVINISASPFSVGKPQVRYELIESHCKRHGIQFLLVNQVGGNDDLVFDGSSLFVGADAEPKTVFPAFEESVKTIDTEQNATVPIEFASDMETVYRALVLGTRDYTHKCGFSQAVIAVSGGIDSAVTAAVAVDALGADNVVGVAMPSPHSSSGSVDDARALARNLGFQLHEVPIAGMMQSYGAALDPLLAGQAPDVTEENIQARIRGNIIMALSNKFGYLPFSTGNKSELAVGYCTLYGDMSGGLAVISDVPKTTVYRLAEYLNRDSERIPINTITKVPSAELKPDQKDQDTLPPYETLDAILELYIDDQQSVDAIVKKGFDRTTVEWVTRAVRTNEYKRKQAAPGLKVTSKAFGSGRRVPIAARYDA